MMFNLSRTHELVFVAVAYFLVVYEPLDFIELGNFASQFERTLRFDFQLVGQHFGERR